MKVELEFTDWGDDYDVGEETLMCDMCEETKVRWWCESLVSGYCQNCMEEIARIESIPSTDISRKKIRDAIDKVLSQEGALLHAGGYFEEFEDEVGL